MNSSRRFFTKCKIFSLILSASMIMAFACTATVYADDEIYPDTATEFADDEVYPDTATEFADDEVYADTATEFTDDGLSPDATFPSEGTEVKEINLDENGEAEIGVSNLTAYGQYYKFVPESNTCYNFNCFIKDNKVAEYVSIEAFDENGKKISVSTENERSDEEKRTTWKFGLKKDKTYYLKISDYNETRDLTFDMTITKTEGWKNPRTGYELYPDSGGPLVTLSGTEKKGYKYTPAASGNYVISLTDLNVGGSIPHFEVYDSMDNLVANVGKEVKDQFETGGYVLYMEKDENYYVCCSTVRSGENASYRLNIRNWSDHMSNVAEDVYAFISHSCYVPARNVGFFRFTPKCNGTYKLVTAGSDVEAGLYDLNGNKMGTCMNLTNKSPDSPYYFMAKNSSDSAITSVLLDCNDKKAAEVDISATNITLERSELAYTGSACEPDVTVTYGKDTLIEDYNYKLFYINHTNVGTAKVMVKGIEGKCTGSKELEFKIIKANQTITAPDFFKTTSDVSFSIGARSSGDGTLSYMSDNATVATVDNKGNVTIRGAGKATITIMASETTNCYAATKSITVNVTEAPIFTVYTDTDGHGTVSASPASATAGATINLTATAKNGYGFKEWTSEDGIMFANPISASTTFTMPGKNVKVKANFEKVASAPVNINNAKVVLKSSKLHYTGKVLKPVVKTIKKLKLKERTDYTTIVKNDKGKVVNSPKDPGKYTLIIQGTGNYTGSTMVQYEIVKGLNFLKVTAKKGTYGVSLSKLENNKQTISSKKIYKFTDKSKTKGTIKYSLYSVKKSGKNVKEGFSISGGSGKLTIKSGVKKGSYKIQVKVSAGNKKYEEVKKYVKFTIKVE